MIRFQLEILKRTFFKYDILILFIYESSINRDIYNIFLKEIVLILLNYIIENEISTKSNGHLMLHLVILFTNLLSVIF